MRQITSNQLTELLTDREPPCISLYQPTHRQHPDYNQDSIRYRNLLRNVETSLSEKYPTREVQPLLEPFQTLVRDTPFWKHRTDGLAVFCSPKSFHILELQRPVQESVVVANHFQVKPLLRILQSADRYQILCLNRQEVKLYEGNRYALDQVELTNVPATISDALGEELTESHQAVRSIPGQISMHHGRGPKKDEVEIDIVRFFRVVDAAVLENHSRPSGLPLMLAALSEYHTPFREVSHNPFLLADGLMINPDALTLDELRELAWKKMEPLYLERLAKLVDAFQVARSRQLGSDNLTEVANAAYAGRVGVLLVEADRVFPGRFNADMDRIESADLGHPEIGDVLDEIAEATLRMKGEVVVVPKERMPTTTGVAATYRF